MCNVSKLLHFVFNAFPRKYHPKRKIVQVDAFVSYRSVLCESGMDVLQLHIARVSKNIYIYIYIYIYNSP